MFGIAAATATAPFWIEGAIVWVLRACRARPSPYVVRLVLSIERDVTKWCFSDNEIEHQSIGTVRCPRVSHLHVLVRLRNDRLDWEPGFLERRIIWEAIQQARARLIRQQLDKVLPTL